MGDFMLLGILRMPIEADGGIVAFTQFRSAARSAADRIEALTAKLADAMEGLEKCQAELDEYSHQEYPLDHPVHERYRQRDYDANPARITLAALKGESHD
jgi:hypothetical protein